MTAGPDETRNDASPEAVGDPSADDVSIVPGFQPDAAPRPGRALDPALDPDRYDPARDVPVPPPPPGGLLDPALDPDRYDPTADDPTLTGLLGERSHEDERDTYQWALGLVGVLLFLALVAWLFGQVLSA